jgi:hypothetical protein
MAPRARSKAADKLLAAPSIREKVEQTVASLELGAEDAAIAEIARFLADTMDASDTEWAPLDLDYEAENADPRRWRDVKLRVRQLEQLAGRVRVIEKAMPSLLVAMKEMGGTPGARQRAENAGGGGNGGPTELDTLRAARRAG